MPVNHRIDPLTHYDVTGDGCWNWRGATNSCGYGQLLRGGKRTKAHRLLYEATKGPIADGLVIDHLCRNRRCVNPDHMECVPVRENTVRGESPVAVNDRKTHCPNGHPYDHVYFLSDGTRKRECRACKRAQNRACKRRKRSPEVPRG